MRKSIRLFRNGCLIRVNGLDPRLFLFLVNFRAGSFADCGGGSGSCIAGESPAAVLDEFETKPSQRAKHNQMQKPKDGGEETAASATFKSAPVEVSAFESLLMEIGHLPVAKSALKGWTCAVHHRMDEGVILHCADAKRNAPDRGENNQCEQDA